MIDGTMRSHRQAGGPYGILRCMTWHMLKLIYLRKPEQRTSGPVISLREREMPVLDQQSQRHYCLPKSQPRQSVTKLFREPASEKGKTTWFSGGGKTDHPPNHVAGEVLEGFRLADASCFVSRKSSPRLRLVPVVRS
ncbi:oxidoreductase short chain dehydrogenase/reductase family [Anopheles sinensis]|uniref:Oxidoreductase short chain dehydrogenase/reductase family n=1 Tax=Anopheles sinensis TaxID=74873 RepID=A0A084VVJ6_ANOSI|nr:oxidoreductase short chain dehydrogenase/reductase family [Anopheles sinensis]